MTCPRCRGKETIVPKNTVHGGASNANLDEPELVHRADGTVEEVTPNPERAAELEHERDDHDTDDTEVIDDEDDADTVDEDEEEMVEFPGNSTESSSEKQETNSNESEVNPESPAPTTEPSSNPDPTGQASVDSVGGHTVSPSTQPPSRNASKQTWLDFVQSHGFDSDAQYYGRDDLIRWWETQSRS
jgi:hypothetical protein